VGEEKWYQGNAKFHSMVSETIATATFFQRGDGTMAEKRTIEEEEFRADMEVAKRTTGSNDPIWVIAWHLKLIVTRLDRIEAELRRIHPKSEGNEE
jgi:hypothetical protein